ncbi:MAG: WxcM-like domain-containing protein [Verrucomicrobia bacterium]|nr:WxcM-like domain-containing protein [Verrucomicrobiota bacterium]
MPDSVDSFLEGSVSRQRLPVMSQSSPSEARDPKRLALPAGELAQLTDGAEVFRYLACLELRAGTTRGNHLHRERRERFYLVAGAATLHLEDPASGSRTSMNLVPGDLIQIAPGIAHALQVTASGTAVEFAPEAFDPADTHRHPVIQP